MPHLLMLTHGPLVGPENLVAPLDDRASTLPWVQHELTEDPTVPALTDEVAGLVVMGGLQNVDEDDPWLEPERQLMRDAIAAGVPVLGVCLGAQQLAVALGGEVRRLPDGYNAAVTPLVRTEAGRAHDVLAGWPDGGRALFHNSRTVSRLPDGATVLLEGSPVTISAWADATDTALAVQFHPEAAPSTARAWEEADGDPDEAYLAACEATADFVRAAGVSLVMRWLDTRVVPRL